MSKQSDRWRRRAKEIANAVVEDLFVNGAGRQATRLVLTDDATPGSNLGGWAKECVRDRVRDIVYAALMADAASPTPGTEG